MGSYTRLATGEAQGGTGGSMSPYTAVGTQMSSGSTVFKTSTAGTAGISGALMFSSGAASSGASGVLDIGAGTAEDGKGGHIRMRLWARLRLHRTRTEV